MSISGALIICRPGGGWSHLISIALKVCIAVVNSALGARQEELCSLCVAFKELQDLLQNDLDPEGTLTPALRILHAGFALCSESTGNNTGDDAERIACLAAKKWLEKAENGLRNLSNLQAASNFANTVTLRISVIDMIDQAVKEIKLKIIKRYNTLFSEPDNLPPFCRPELLATPPSSSTLDIIVSSINTTYTKECQSLQVGATDLDGVLFVYALLFCTHRAVGSFLERIGASNAKLGSTVEEMKGMWYETLLSWFKENSKIYPKLQEIVVTSTDNTPTQTILEQLTAQGLLPSTSLPQKGF